MEIKKTKDWVEVTGSVTAARSFLIGEVSTPFVDVIYYFNEVKIFAKNVDPYGVNSLDYPPGLEIKLLVNPLEPSECLALRKVGYDPILKQTASAKK